MWDSFRRRGDIEVPVHRHAAVQAIRPSQFDRRVNPGAHATRGSSGRDNIEIAGDAAPRRRFDTSRTFTPTEGPVTPPLQTLAPALFCQSHRNPSPTIRISVRCPAPSLRNERLRGGLL